MVGLYGVGTYEMPNNLTLKQLECCIKVFLITDTELKPLPPKLVEQLSKPLRRRWINLNRSYYENARPSSAPSTR